VSKNAHIFLNQIFFKSYVSKITEKGKVTYPSLPLVKAI